MTSPSKDRGRAEFGALLRQFVERKIELRAYEIYEQRGRTDGQALADWFNAEAEILLKVFCRPSSENPKPFLFRPATTVRSIIR